MTRARKNLRISRPLLVSLFFSFTLVIVAPLHIYLTNRLEFAFSTRELVVSLSPVFLVLFLALACFLALLRGPMRSISIATVFVLSILLWVQGNLLSQAAENSTFHDRRSQQTSECQVCPSVRQVREGRLQAEHIQVLPRHGYTPPASDDETVRVQGA